MSLDLLANYADIVAVPIGIVGVVLIVRQLSLTRQESEKEHQRRQNEMTLNAYNAVRGDLRETIRRVRIKLELKDMFTPFTEKKLEQIISDQVLRDDVFNIQLLNDLSGTLFIETFNQFKLYIDWVRKDVKIFYVDYERLVEKLKGIERGKDLEECPF